MKYRPCPKEAFLEVVTPHASTLALISPAQGSLPVLHNHSHSKYGSLPRKLCCPVKNTHLVTLTIVLALEFIQVSLKHQAC